MNGTIGGTMNGITDYYSTPIWNNDFYCSVIVPSIVPCLKAKKSTD
jgi:hypothetical protein